MTDINNTIICVNEKDEIVASCELEEAKRNAKILHRQIVVFVKHNHKLYLSKDRTYHPTGTAVPQYGHEPYEVDEQQKQHKAKNGGPKNYNGILNCVRRTFPTLKQSQKLTVLTRVLHANVLWYVVVVQEPKPLLTIDNGVWKDMVQLKQLQTDNLLHPMVAKLYERILNNQQDMQTIHVLVGGDVSKKQGGYGTLKVHKESTVSQFSHLDELFGAFWFLYVKPLKNNLDTQNDANLAFCNDILVQVSRSFAAVIQQLPPNNNVDICIFYLVLRALDTIEDDTTAFDSHATKIQHLTRFCSDALWSPNDWTLTGVGQGDEARLLMEFPKVQRVFRTLPPCSQTIIADITTRMANGMAEFVDKDLGQGTTTMEQYNLYCHYVAGLVGEGLSRLFAGSKLEHESLAKELVLSDQMGLFLQKTNIIRDFLEDYIDQRAFWPQQVWKKYAKTGELGYFCQQSDETVRVQSLECLNELVVDALLLVPDCLAYLSKLQCKEIFRFCAIPQVMAIATLEKLYNNSNVFTGVVKIRKGLSCKLILNCTDLAKVHSIFYEFAAKIKAKSTNDATTKICDEILSLTACHAQSLRRTQHVRQLSVVLAVACLCCLLYSDQSWKLVWQTALVIGISVVFLSNQSFLSPPSNLQPASLLHPTTKTL